MQNIDVEKILNLKKEEYCSFVDKQAKAFGCVNFFCPNQTDDKCTKTDKFFFKDSKVLTGYAPIVFDDVEPYCLLFDNIKKYVNKKDKNDQSKLLIKLLKIVQLSVFEYYGIGKPDEAEMLLLLKEYYFKDQNIPISAFKHTNNSFCIERACLAHNFFKLIGISSETVSQNIYMNGTKILHMFNVLKIDNKYFLYDLLNTYHTKSIQMPSFVFEHLDDKQGEMAFDGSKQSQPIILQNVAIKSQTGKNYTIDYGPIKTTQEVKTSSF